MLRPIQPPITFTARPPDGSHRPIAVIGAGPAGTLAAVLLHRAGFQVSLIEQHRFPRDKVCGECLSALGHDVLFRAGLWPAVSRAGAIPLRKALLVAPDGRSGTMALPRPMWGISRLAMDTILLDQARDAGVQILQPVRCEALTPAAGAVHLRLRDLASNTSTDHSFDCVVLADGKGALVGDRPQPTGDLGVKAHFADVDLRADSIALFGLHGHYVGVAPVENAGFNMAMNVPAHRVDAVGGDLDALMRQILRENTGLAERLARARRVSPWRASPLPRFALRDAIHPRILRIGNAAAAIEPIGGEGMGLALRSAELSATVLQQGGDATDALSAIATLWPVRRIICRAAALLASNSVTCGLGVETIATLPGLCESLMGLLGKAPDVA